MARRKKASRRINAGACRASIAIGITKSVARAAALSSFREYYSRDSVRDLVSVQPATENQTASKSSIEQYIIQFVRAIQPNFGGNPAVKRLLYKTPAAKPFQGGFILDLRQILPADRAGTARQIHSLWYAAL